MIARQHGMGKLRTKEMSPVLSEREIGLTGMIEGLFGPNNISIE